MRSPVLCVFWVALVLWFELGTFLLSARLCSWPQNVTSYKNVLVITDPQILNKDSYPGRSAWLMALTRLVVDLNLRKSWRAVRTLHPDLVVFLGDMMDGGRDDMSDIEYEAYFERFRGIFAYGRHLSPSNILYIPGNHDVGLGKHLVFSAYARKRFSTHFGPLNQLVQVADRWSFTLLDAPKLVDEDDERISYGFTFEQWAPSGGPLEFVKTIPPGTNNNSLILFTHIPLYRPKDAGCGPLRERGTIRPGRGGGYENMLGPELSQFLLEKLKPALILSGDDHDYCENFHPNNVREVTVKALSMAMGIRRPGFQLLSVSKNNNNYSDRACLLPDQLWIYTKVYLPCFVVTILALAAHSAWRIDDHEQLPLSEKKRRRWWTLVPRRDGRRYRRGLGGRLMTDLRDVGSVPLLVFWIVTMYTFLL